ncbi:ABC transporter permease [Desulfosarcina ovata]|uniref:Membrane protein n=1 Tax=Desulfosarcina ovata subsp. ovata TaxID=2752305 RepID=A0A5K8AER7_9BACT|nr:FtsX-like permease family protein [Desulfosarcina ovata]BBO91016.1 membrane protein [Desulfosarcina ovata subsp. ovata]
MKHLTTIWRQARRSSRQALLFVLCVALALTTLTAFSGFARSIALALAKDARNLHAADIVVRSYAPVAPALTQAIDRLAAQGAVQVARIYELSSVVRATDESASLFSRLKVVEPGYPFYGQVSLASGRPFGQVLAPGTAIVEQTLLDRTGLRVGDALKVGYTTLTIVDVVIAEPDRPLELFAFGPRVFIHAADLKAMGLMATGSRIRRLVLLKVSVPTQVDAVAATLKQANPDDTTRIDTYLTARSAVKRFLDNFLFFLKLVGLFILIVAGLGIQSTLTALFNEKRTTIAVMKAVGAGGRFITVHFLLLIALLGAVGSGLGMASGVAVQFGLAGILAPFLPEGLQLSIAWRGIAEAVGLGAAVVILFSLLPLYRLKALRPVQIFNRQRQEAASRWPGILFGLVTFCFFLVLVLWHMRDIRFGITFVGAIAAMILAAAGLAQLALGTIRRLPIRHLALRQAVRGLFRRGNATRTVLITLTVSLTVIFGDLLIERNLNATFVRSFPDDMPDAYFIDIQRGQTEAFVTLVGRPVTFYPIVRARVMAINGAAIDHGRESSQRRDNLARVFNLTYRETLLDDETLIQGDSLFRSDWDEPQVSVMDTVLDMRPMRIGDRIRFSIQGVALTARIASIRTRDNRALSPFFYFVFPTPVLEKAPQTLFAALKVPTGELGRLQNRIVAHLPNISVIDMSQTLGTLARLMSRLARILRLFSLFSIAAGILILISAVFATRNERMLESVYYKILGAGQRFVLSVFALENLIIGLLGGSLALCMAQAGAWWICVEKFDIAYRPFVPLSLALIAVTTLLTIAVGLFASRSIMAKKPVVFLREQQNG